MSKEIYYRIIKECDGHQILSTPHRDTADTIAQQCSLLWKKTLCVIAVLANGSRQETETVARFVYRRLLHEDQSYDEMERVT